MTSDLFFSATLTSDLFRHPPSAPSEPALPDTKKRESVKIRAEAERALKSDRPHLNAGDGKLGRHRSDVNGLLGRSDRSGRCHLGRVGQGRVDRGGLLSQMKTVFVLITDRSIFERKVEGGAQNGDGRDDNDEGKERDHGNNVLTALSDVRLITFLEYQPRRLFPIERIAQRQRVRDLSVTGRIASSQTPSPSSRPVERVDSSDRPHRRTPQPRTL